MKQTFFSDIIIKNIFLLKLKLPKEGINENSKKACELLFSVIVLVCTVTGIAGPLRNSELKLAKESSYMQKEIELYREFASNEKRQEQQLQQQIQWQLLRAKLPEKIDPEQFVRLLYKKAERDGVRIQKIKQILDKANKSKSGNPGCMAWEMECSGDWSGLMAFLGELEGQAPLTRLSRAEIIRARHGGELSLQADVHVYLSL